MFFRLIELILGVYYGSLAPNESETHTEKRKTALDVRQQIELQTTGDSKSHAKSTNDNCA